LKFKIGSFIYYNLLLKIINFIIGWSLNPIKKDYFVDVRPSITNHQFMNYGEVNTNMNMWLSFIQTLKKTLIPEYIEFWNIFNNINKYSNSCRLYYYWQNSYSQTLFVALLISNFTNFYFFLIFTNLNKHKSRIHEDIIQDKIHKKKKRKQEHKTKHVISCFITGYYYTVLTQF
jgi:Ca2+/H+ antiporter